VTLIEFYNEPDLGKKLSKNFSKLPETIQMTLPNKHVNLAPYVALVITKIFFEINKHQPLIFEKKY
jgi:hypothetical protein